MKKDNSLAYSIQGVWMEAEDVRVFGRTRAIAALVSGVMLIPFWLALPREKPWALRLQRWFHRLVVNGHGLHLSSHGTPRQGPGTMFVANHVSWIDISVLASVLNAAFVAKDDVAGWPLIGRLARRCGTIFVTRDRPRDIAIQRRELGERLADSSVILFPEGTTSIGSGLLPFRTSLFAAAGSATVIQPVTLVYRKRSGGELTVEQKRAIAWLDDDELFPHAMKLARAKGLCVDVYFEQPVEAADRKVQAETCRQRILNRLLDGQAAAMNRVA